MGEELKDQVAIVTGGGGGIGSRIAREFARAGADVVVASRSQQKLDPIVDEVQAMGRNALAVATDVTDPAQVDNLIEQTLSTFGKLDVLVNNAGGAMFIKPPEVLSPDEWNAAIALNLTSVFLCSAAAGRVMIEQNRGKIINISSVAGIKLSPGFVHYGAAKAGVINLTRSLATCWGPHNINVNCIAPGLTATEGVADWLPPSTNEDGTPVPRLQLPPDPEDVAALTLFLASSSSDRISGETLPIRMLREIG